MAKVSRELEAVLRMFVDTGFGTWFPGGGTSLPSTAVCSLVAPSRSDFNGELVEVLESRTAFLLSRLERGSRGIGIE